MSAVNCKPAHRVAASVSPTILPAATDGQKKCFDLLKRAYIEACYSRGCRIARAQLEYLAEPVKNWQGLKEKIREARIES